MLGDSNWLDRERCARTDHETDLKPINRVQTLSAEDETKPGTDQPGAAQTWRRCRPNLPEDTDELERIRVTIRSSSATSADSAHELKTSGSTHTVHQKSASDWSAFWTHICDSFAEEVKCISTEIGSIAEEVATAGDVLNNKITSLCQLTLGQATDDTMIDREVAQCSEEEQEKTWTCELPKALRQDVFSLALLVAIPAEIGSGVASSLKMAAFTSPFYADYQFHRRIAEAAAAAHHQTWLMSSLQLVVPVVGTALCVHALRHSGYFSSIWENSCEIMPKLTKGVTKVAFVTVCADIWTLIVAAMSIGDPITAPLRMYVVGSVLLAWPATYVVDYIAKMDGFRPAFLAEVGMSAVSVAWLAHGTMLVCSQASIPSGTGLLYFTVFGQIAFSWAVITTGLTGMISVTVSLLMSGGTQRVESVTDASQRAD